MNLVIVESPSKGRTLEHFLGSGFTVRATYGHLRDLPRKALGVDVKNGFEPKYVVPRKSQKVVTALKEEIEQADQLYLATDFDREGEAIAWHLIKATKLDQERKMETKKNNGEKELFIPHVHRITFHEITKQAILDSLKHPRGIDLDLVNAQQARRVLDRLVGYKLSPFLWRKITSRLSAGRVQSVALKLIVDREKEIEKFRSQEYWDLTAQLAKAGQKFSAKLFKIGDKVLKKLAFLKPEPLKKIIPELQKADFIVSSIETKETARHPFPPFTTSTLQQEAIRRLGFSSKKTMFLAQQLYEGVDLGPHGRLGLITYMRTDSVQVAESALRAAQKVVAEKLGSAYSLPVPRAYKTKQRLAQEAHEAIRPTHPGISPEVAGKYLEKDSALLYELVWRRFLASQTREARLVENRVEIKATDKYFFEAKGSKVVFDGFLALFPEIEEKLHSIPQLKQGDKVRLLDLVAEQHFTQPPDRYTEAGLIKTLEEYGIGRPSTYSPIIQTLLGRRYVGLVKRHFIPEELGRLVSDLLSEHFSDIVDTSFTAKMEEDLDRIADGEIAWNKVISDFYGPFEKHLEQKYAEIKKEDVVGEGKESIKCDVCGRPMVIRISKYGRFWACTGFPDCHNTKQIIVSTGLKCPDCDKGEVIERRTRRGRIFWGCSRYPRCHYASWDNPQTRI